MLSAMVGAVGVLYFFCSLLGSVVAQEGVIRYNEVVMASCADEQGEVMEEAVSSELSDTLTIASNASCLSGGQFQGVTVRVFSSNATEEHPLVVVARQGMREKIFSWRIPYYPNELNISFRSVDRTLCPVNISSELDLVYLDVYTTSPQPIHYQVSAQLLPNFNLQFNDSMQFLVTPASPKIFYFKFPPGQSAAKIKLNSLAPSSASSGCFILSAQRNACPFYYLAEDIGRGGFYQTVNTTTVLEVRKDEIGSDEIIVAVIALNRTQCSRIVNSSIYSNETFNLIIVDTPPLSEFGIMIAFPILVFFVGVVPIIIIFTFFHIFSSCDFLVFCKIRLRFYKFGRRSKETVVSSSVEDGSTIEADEKNLEEERPSITDPEVNVAVQNRSRSEIIKELKEGATKYINEQQKKFYEVNCGKQVCFPKLASKKHFMKEEPSEDYSARVNRHFMFLWNTLIISVYYGLPAVQHLYTLIQITKFTGEGDRCYFNYKCAHSFGMLTSFNNFWSNIAYLLFGALFLVIAVVKNVTYCVAKQKKAVRDYTGLPEYFGIYYAMGVLAIMQGIMSAFYHICPTQANFQYDNASMVIFGGLVIVHTVHKRHPVERLNAGLTYVLFSFITSLILLGLITDAFTGKEWNVFLGIVFFLLALNFTFAFYCLHDWKFLGGRKQPEDDDVDNFETYCLCCISWLKRHKWKIIKISFGTIMNVLIAIVYFSSKNMAFANAVLILFFINDIFFVIFYLVAKVYHREYFSSMSMVTGILTLVFLIPAAYCLSHTEYTTEDTPSLSRQLNGECTLGGFYDIHDMWHFLSSMAMFFCYVTLLTLDDGVNLVERWKLHSF